MYLQTIPKKVKSEGLSSPEGLATVPRVTMSFSAGVSVVLGQSHVTDEARQVFGVTRTPVQSQWPDSVCFVCAG